MKMKQRKQVYYKCIFKQDEQKETVEYKEEGVLSIGKTSKLTFQTQDMVIHITYNDKEIILSHGQSVLRFDYQKDVYNDYQLPYGCVSLKTRLLSFVADDDRIKMKYELYDQQGLLLTAYLLVRLLPMEYEEDI